MTTVERIVPCTSLPYIIFLPKALYFFITSVLGSDSRTKGNLILLDKLIVRVDAILADAQHHGS